VYSRVEGPKATDLVLASRAGTDITPLTDDPEIEWYARVSPAGDRAVYARSLGEFGAHEVWVLDLPPLVVEPTTWTKVKAAYRQSR
jgi:hypothetical protein